WREAVLIAAVVTTSSKQLGVSAVQDKSHLTTSSTPRLSLSGCTKSKYRSASRFLISADIADRKNPRAEEKHKVRSLRKRIINKFGTRIVGGLSGRIAPARAWRHPALLCR